LSPTWRRTATWMAPCIVLGLSLVREERQGTESREIAAV
jgi:hypothetical protein